MTLTATGGNLGSGAVYQWGTGATVGSSIAGTTTAATYLVTPGAAATYWVQLIGNTNCTNTTGGVTLNITVLAPATNGQAANACGCATGTTDCSGNCTTTGTYTTNDGVCAGSCQKAYVQLRNQCGAIENAQFGTYDAPTCYNGCPFTPECGAPSGSQPIAPLGWIRYEIYGVGACTYCASNCLSMYATNWYVYTLSGNMNCYCYVKQ